jgi:hypothetical protein
VQLMAATAVAIGVLPFALGYWIGHGALAAAPFAALGLTVLIRQIQVSGEGDPIGGLLAGILASTAISAVAAYGGGRLRERYRRTR